MKYNFMLVFFQKNEGSLFKCNYVGRLNNAGDEKGGFNPHLCKKILHNI